MARFLCFLIFNPFMFFFWFLMADLFFIIFLFLLFICFYFIIFFCWGRLGYIFGCDLISYGLILLSLWICVLIVLARESIFRFGYFSGFLFLFLLFLLLRCIVLWEELVHFHFICFTKLGKWVFFEGPFGVLNV